MTAIAVRKKLHAFIDSMEEKKALAIYTLFQEEIEQGERINVAQYNQELAEAEAEYEKGEYVTHEEMVKQIKKW
jgi:predicted transcriptional regulator